MSTKNVLALSALILAVATPFIAALNGKPLPRLAVVQPTEVVSTGYVVVSDYEPSCSIQAQKVFWSAVKAGVASHDAQDLSDKKLAECRAR